MKSKVILVNFWATWCPPCREEIPDLIALQEKYRDQLQIIGVSQDSGRPIKCARFAAEHGMNYPVVMTTPEIEKLFPGVYALPTSFIIDREGRIAQKHVGMLNAALTEIETRALAGLDADAPRRARRGRRQGPPRERRAGEQDSRHRSRAASADENAPRRSSS